MLIAMNEDIQSVIMAVQSYKRFIIHDYLTNKCRDIEFDWYKKVFEYYKSLEIPDGMAKNYMCFDAVLTYPIEDTIDTPSNRLMEEFKFGY